MKKLALVITILSLLSVNLLGPAVSANAYTKLCEVDIGDPLSEAGHNLQSWGPIEPDAHPSPPPNDAWSGLSGNARVIWGFDEGTPCATLTLDRHLADGVARMIRLTFLDGMHYADLISDDSFTMEVKSNGAPDTEYQQVFAHTGGFTRQWLTVDIDLAPATNLDANGFIDVRLCATGPQWGFFGSDLGQVAFDRIELYGDIPDTGQGLTPGYWKNHLSAWSATGYSPTDDFDTTFGVDWFDPDITLEDALNLGGGNLNALARHAVAALLNAAHPGVGYPMTVAEVIAAIAAVDETDEDAVESLKDTLDDYNNLGGSI